MGLARYVNCHRNCLRLLVISKLRVAPRHGGGIVSTRSPSARPDGGRSSRVDIDITCRIDVNADLDRNETEYDTLRAHA
jgi:hypothetical protein